MTKNVIALRPEIQELQFYDSGCRALDKATSVDEVTEIVDKAVAISHYARQIKNHKLFADAHEIKIRARRKRGKLVAEMRREGTLAERGYQRNVVNEDIPRTLSDIGISRDEAVKEARLAGIADSTFKNNIKTMRAKIENEGKIAGFDKVFIQELRRQPPDIDKVVSRTWMKWNKFRDGKEIQKLKEIASHRSHAEQTGIDNLASSIEKTVTELNKIIKKLRST